MLCSFIFFKVLILFAPPGKILIRLHVAQQVRTTYFWVTMFLWQTPGANHYVFNGHLKMHLVKAVAFMVTIFTKTLHMDAIGKLEQRLQISQMAILPFPVLLPCQVSFLYSISSLNNLSSFLHEEFCDFLTNIYISIITGFGSPD